MMDHKSVEAASDWVKEKATMEQGGHSIAKSGESDPSPSAKDDHIDVIRQIVQRMTLKQLGSQSQMLIKLKPDTLGQLRMQIVTENHQVAVRMTAETSAVKDLIEQHVHHLKNELHLQGLEVQKIDVAVQHDNSGSQLGPGPDGFGTFARKRENGQKGRQGRQTGTEQENTAPDSADRLTTHHSRESSMEVDYFV